MTARRLAAAVVGGALALVALGGPATAQAPAPAHDLQVRRIDSTNPDAVSVAFEYDGPAADLAGLTASENGKPVEAKAVPIADAKLTDSVVFMVDSSESTNLSGVLAEARKAVSALSAKLPGAQLALVTAGAEVALIQRFTTDPALIQKGLDSLTPTGDGALWEGVVRAAAQFTTLGDAVPTIVLITDGNGAPGVDFQAAVGAVSDIGAEVQTLAVAGGPLDALPRQLSEGSGGLYQETAKAVDLSELAGNLQPRVTGQYALTYKTGSVSGVNDLTVTVGGVSVKNSYVAGSVSVGIRSLAFEPPATGSGIAFFQNDLGKLLAVVLGVAAAGMAAYALLNVLVKDNSLRNVLRPYAESSVATSEDDDAGQGLAQNPLMQRAVDFTEQLAQRQGLLVKVEDALERANLPLRAAEAIFFYFASAVVLSLLLLVLLRSPIVALVAFVVILLLAPTVLNVAAGRRKRKFESQLPDTLQLLSGTLRAGYSMMQGVEAVSEEVDEPMGRELRRVVTESRLGRPLELSLDGVGERMASNDFAWATMAIRIQREVGGNLSELLMTVAETMSQRERLRRDVKTLTAEGRMSAYVLGVMPPGLALVMYTLNPAYMAKLTEGTFGYTLLGGAVLMMLGGFLWMSKIIKIEI